MTWTVLGVAFYRRNQPSKDDGSVSHRLVR